MFLLSVQAHKHILYPAAHQIHTQSTQRITGSDIGSIVWFPNQHKLWKPITSNMMLHETMKVVTVTHSPHILLHFVSSFFAVITYNSDTHMTDKKKQLFCLYTVLWTV